MSKSQQKDNSTFEQKARLRTRTLMMIENPVIMETHGGNGRLFARCYSHIKSGIVLEKDPSKVARLAIQRPTWAVYEANSERAVKDGVGAHLAVNFLDLDPYVQPWPIIEGFFASDRPFPERLAVVVNDGLRQKLRMNGGWVVESLREIVSEIGNAKLHANYLEVSRTLLARYSAIRGYSIAKWTGYQCGHNQDMTHYAAILERWKYFQN